MVTRPPKQVLRHVERITRSACHGGDCSWRSRRLDQPVVLCRRNVRCSCCNSPSPAMRSQHAAI